MLHLNATHWARLALGQLPSNPIGMFPIFGLEAVPFLPNLKKRSLISRSIVLLFFDLLTVRYLDYEVIHSRTNRARFSYLATNPMPAKLSDQTHIGQWLLKENLKPNCYTAYV
jgi:hypothetical protein